jgi:DNA-binding SARP family transcriptional activator/tetratricopeptide (TPR) repeat protein
VDTRKAVAVLAVVALEGRRTREQLAAMLWPDSEPERARGALRRTLSVLTSGLGPGRLVADRAGVELADGAWTDVARADELEAAVAAHAHDGDGCSDCRTDLRELVELHRGPFLDGFHLRDAADFDAWCDAVQERRRRQLVAALDRRSGLDADAGDLDACLDALARWRALDPLNEQVYRRLMLVNARSGDRPAAVRAYRDCVAVLDRELGVAPLESTTRLYQAVLDGQQAGRTAAGRPRPEPGAARPVSPTPTAVAALPPGRRPIGELPFVGRSRGLEDARARLRGAGAVVLVTGEAGIGKTRFVDELEAVLHRDGATVLAARCHRGEEGLAYGPVAEVLRSRLDRADVERRLLELPEWQRTEVSRLLPELGVGGAPPPPLEQEGARLRFFDALAAGLEAVAVVDGHPAVLVVEDLQLADVGTLDLLGWLARRLTQRRLRLVLTWRPEDVVDDQRLRLLVGDPDVQERTLALALERLGDADARRICEHALGPHPGLDGIVERLRREAEGLPLALGQYLGWLAEGPGDVDADWPLPTGLREVVAGRLDELDGTAAQVVAAAAVVGHGFDAPLLVAVSGRSEEETVDALDELLARRVVVASRDGSFELAHERVRTVAYDRLSPARRRLLHARAATALAAQVGRRGQGRLAAPISEHARRAGQPEEAAGWSVAAGDHAASVYANAEALEHYEAALALSPSEPAAIHRRIARLHVLAGDYPAAFRAYEVAAAHAEEPATLTAVEHELGALHIRRRHWSAARLHLETALAGSDAADPARRARIHADLGLVALQCAELTPAARHAREALTLAEQVEDRQALAQARNLAGMIARRRGRVADAQRHLEHAAALAAHLRDPSAYIAALNNLALTTADAGEEDRARQLLTVALERCDRQGDRHRQAALLNNLADLHHRSGDEDGAMVRLRQAVALFAEVDDRAVAEPAAVGPRPRDPEVWKLVEW